MSTTPPSMSQALKWLDDQGHTHFGATARNMKTAVTRFDQCRAKNEPDSAAWVLENLETLGHRLARKETGLKPDSLRVYVSRVRSALESFLSWTESPIGWSPKRKAKKLSRTHKAPATSALKLGPPQKTKDSGEDHQHDSLEAQITLALVAIADWPLLRPYLMDGLARAMAEARGTKE